MSKLDELRAKVAGLREEIVILSDIPEDEITPEQEARFADALPEYETGKAELDAAEERSRKVDDVRKSHTGTHDGIDTVNVIKRDDPFNGDVMRATRSELRDRGMKVLELHGKGLSPAQLDHAERLLRASSEQTDGAVIARRLLTTETPAYRSAFLKGVTQDSPAFTPEEVRAVNEFRAANEGTPSAGGMGVPVLIDPSIILTSAAADAPILAIAKTVTITTNQWKGVSSAGVTWSYDAEASAVSDDAATLAQPTIPVYAARGFIPYSIEVGDDYPGFASEMSQLLGHGFVDLLASQTMVGSGVASPTGIFTRMANTTVGSGAAHVVVQTAGSLSAADIRKAWGALPERYRSRASWVLSTSVENVIRAFGNNLAMSDYTVNLAANGTGVLTGRPVVLSDYAPGFTGTTNPANLAVVGDFSNFLIVQRAGMTVELVSHLFDTVTGRPTGQRGWFAFARHGFDAINPAAFRLLTNN